MMYKEILNQAWKTTWNNKYLWFFGLFAALLGGGGEYDILFRSFNGEANQAIFPSCQRIIETGVFSANTFSNIGKIMKEDPVSLFVLLIVLLVILGISIFLVWLSVVSQSALVNNSAGYIAKKKGDFKSGMAVGIKNFWSVLSLNIIAKAFIYFAFVLVSLPVVLTITKPEMGLAKFIYILAFVVFVPVALSISFIAKYAIAYVVIKGDKFVDSIREGLDLFKKNWLVSLEMAFILFLINIFVGLIIVLAVMVLTIPFLFLALAFYKMASVFGFYLIVFAGMTLLLAVIVLGGSALSTFQISSWTGLFTQLNGKGGTSKIVRIFAKK